MKLIISSLLKHGPEENISGLGARWFVYDTLPPVTISKPDQAYWRYLHLHIFIIRRSLLIELRLTRLPFRNLKQYRDWRRGNI